MMAGLAVKSKSSSRFGHGSPAASSGQWAPVFLRRMMEDHGAVGNRFALIHRVESMKRDDSRARKISEMVEMLARGETLYPQKAGRP